MNTKNIAFYWDVISSAHERYFECIMHGVVEPMTQEAMTKLVHTIVAFNSLKPLHIALMSVPDYMNEADVDDGYEKTREKQLITWSKYSEALHEIMCGLRETLNITEKQDSIIALYKAQTDINRSSWDD
jgi:hypothetical protein